MPTMPGPQNRRTLWLGAGIAVTGLLCLTSGLALLIWQLANPEQAAKLSQSIVVTAEPTPSPGYLSTPLAPPPLPSDAAAIAILPESEQPTATLDRTAQPASVTPSLTLTLTPTASPTMTDTTQVAPTATLSPTLRRTPTRTPYTPPTRTPTPTPTAYATASGPAIVPERIIIDRIALDAPVIPVGQHALTIGERVFGQWDVPRERAAGWHHTSATIGSAGNLVLNGHHNVYGEVFRYLRVLQPGDLLRLESGGRRFNYIVVQTMTLPEQNQPVDVRLENARWILPTGDERVTLITCWPYYSNTHRLVVIARPIDAVIPPAAIP